VRVIVKAGPPPIVRPSGLQPALWIQPAAAHSAGSSIVDYRVQVGEVAPGTLPTIVGTDTLAASVQANGKLAYTLTGASMQCGELRMDQTSGFTILAGIKWTDLNGQQYLFSLGPGTNGDVSVFDCYNNSGQVNLRIAASGGGFDAGFSYTGAGVNKFGFSFRSAASPQDTEPNLAVLDARTGDNLMFEQANGVSNGPWRNNPVWICCGQYGQIPIPAGSELYYWQIYKGGLTSEKMLQWTAYLNTLA
jgi:hypothetical protein